jgi:hypothetical protein
MLRRKHEVVMENNAQQRILLAQQLNLLEKQRLWTMDRAVQALHPLAMLTLQMRG